MQYIYTIYIYILLNALKYSYYYYIENFMIYGKNQRFFPNNRLKNENTKFRKYRGYTVIGPILFAALV